MATFNDPSELPGRVRGRIGDILASDETFVLGVRSPGLLTRWLPYYILTDRRLIRYRKAGFKEERDEYRLGALSHVGFDGTGVGGTIELEGSGMDEDFAVGGGGARDLADALRGQLNKQKRPA